MSMKKAIPLFGGLFVLLLGTALATASNDSVTFSQDINPPSTKSFDISWVDNSTGNYFFTDRTNKAIDMFDARNDTFTGYIGQGVFAGGPNGVLTDSAGLVWAGDNNSTIKVLKPEVGTGSAALINSISTGGVQRADELSYDPQDQIILIANDHEGFLTFINVATQSVETHFYYADNTVSKPATVSGHATAGNGIEQSVWDPQTRLFYQAVPGSATATGFIDVFTPSGTLVNTFPVPGCTNGPTGLALGNNGRFLGACANGAAAVELRNGTVDAIVPDVGGADEVWFNPGDDNFYLGISRGQTLGVVSQDDKVVAVLTGHGGHSVAAYAANNHIFDPESNGSGVAVFTSNLLVIPAITVPGVTVPGVTVSTPVVTITTPAVTTPAVTTPAVTIPAPTLPSVSVPAVVTGSFTIPGVTVSTPAVTTPAMTTPAGTVSGVTVSGVTVTTPAVKVP